jgi:hypothetical protein
MVDMRAWRDGLDARFGYLLGRGTDGPSFTKHAFPTPHNIVSAASCTRSVTLMSRILSLSPRQGFDEAHGWN